MSKPQFWFIFISKDFTTIREDNKKKKPVTSESNSLKENLENYHDYYFGKPEVGKK